MTSTKEIKHKLKNHWDELHLVLRHYQVLELNLLAVGNER